MSLEFFFCINRNKCYTGNLRNTAHDTAGPWVACQQTGEYGCILWISQRDRWKYKSQLEQIYYRLCCQTLSHMYKWNTWGGGILGWLIANMQTQKQARGQRVIYTHTRTYSPKIYAPVTGVDMAFLPTAYKNNDWAEKVFLESIDTYTPSSSPAFIHSTSVFPAEDFGMISSTKCNNVCLEKRAELALLFVYDLVLFSALGELKKTLQFKAKYSFSEGLMATQYGVPSSFSTRKQIINLYFHQCTMQERQVYSKHICIYN